MNGEPEDEKQFEDEIVKYRKERMRKARETRAAANTSTEGNFDDTLLLDMSESQQEAMAELAEALKNNCDVTAKSNGTFNLTSVIDSDLEDDIKEWDTTRSYTSRGKVGSNRGSKRGARSSRASTRGASSSRSTAPPRNNATLGLFRLTVRTFSSLLLSLISLSLSVLIQSSKKQVKNETAGDDDTSDVENQANGRGSDRPIEDVFSRRLSRALATRGEVVASPAVPRIQQTTQRTHRPKVAPRF